MAKSHGSVRMGPISLFALIIILCLAVMAVLAITTAQATYALTQRQAAAAEELYAAETAAQRLVGGIDAELARARTDGATPPGALAAVDRALPQLADEAAGAAALPLTARVEAVSPDKAAGLAGIVGVGRTGDPSVDGVAMPGVTPLLDDVLGAVSATFTTEGGRTLDVVIAICDDGRYEVLSWKATTEWNEEGAGETLWSGSPSLG